MVGLVKIFVLFTLVCTAVVRAEQDYSEKDLPVERQEEEEETIFERIFRDLHDDPAPKTQSRVDIKIDWIEQKLDQFNASDNTTWRMRYMSNDQFYREGGPIFIYVGGEWEISSNAISGGHIYEMAKDNKGYLFYTEHRYYGQSKPTKDLSTANLKYLHVRQALADLEHFIKTMKATIPGAQNSSVILVGGSYSASMVTWFKKVYPKVATGCWASSAPLLAKMDFSEYKEVTGQSIRLVSGNACYDRIRSAINEMEMMFRKKRGAEIKAMLKLCNSFDETDDLDRWTLFSEISEIFAHLVQTHTDGKIQGACNKIMEGPNHLDGLARYVLSVLPSRGCYDFTYKTYIAPLIKVDYSKNMMRQWIYQTCNEYGWFQTSTSPDQPFGTEFPLDYFVTICTDLFGEQFTEDYILQKIMQTNNYFEALRIRVDNVYMTHGQLDPWRAMGIQNPDRATVIPMYAHCKDLAAISRNDSPAMRASKEKIAQLVSQWVAAGNRTNSETERQVGGS